MNIQNNSHARSPKTKRLQNAVLDVLIVGVFVFGVLGCTCNRFEAMKSGNSKTIERRQASDTSSKAAPNNNDTETLVALTNLIAQFATYYNTGNKQGLERILADDFIGYTSKGETLTKRKVINNAKNEETYKSVKVDKARLVANDDSTAKVSCTVIREYKDQTDTNDVTYTFARQSGVWRIKS